VAGQRLAQRVAAGAVQVAQPVQQLARAPTRSPGEKIFESVPT
jgi:hypothetical protein